MMVTVAVSSAPKVASRLGDGALNTTGNVSLTSTAVSLEILTVKVLLVSRGAKVRVPDALV